MIRCSSVLMAVEISSTRVLRGVTFSAAFAALSWLMFELLLAALLHRDCNVCRGGHLVLLLLLLLLQL